MSRKPHVRRTLLVLLTVSALVITIFMPGGVLAKPAKFTEQIDITATVDMTLEVQQCDNRGVTIDLEGPIAFGGVGGRLVFSNRFVYPEDWKKENVADGVVTTEITPFAGHIVAQKRGSHPQGVGGNPWITFEFNDEHGNPSGEYQTLGRCVQGAKGKVFKNLPIPVSASAMVQSLSCTNKGSTLDFTGENIANGGVSGRIILSNQIQQEWAHPGNHNNLPGDAAIMDLTLVTAEDLSNVRKGGPTGPGGNPHIWFAFLDEGGDEYGPRYYAGRCKDLGGEKAGGGGGGKGKG